MVITTKDIPYKLGQTIKLKVISDVHYGNTYCDLAAFKEYLGDPKDNTLFIGIGDLFDSILPSDPRYVKHGDSIKATDVLDIAVSDMTKMLFPYRDRIIGMGRGNHESELLKRHGTNLTKRLSENLGCPDLGYSGLYKLNFSENGGRGRTLVIRYHHGWGGGSRTQGGDLTKFSKDMAYWVADLFLYGHVHRKITDTVDRLGLAGKKLISRPKFMCICGTFLKTYSSNTNSTYSEEKGYPPVSIGGLTVNIKPDSNWLTMSADV